MKTIQFIVVAILLSISNNIYAQDKFEIQGQNNTYIQENGSPGFYVIYNKNNIFTKSTPGYLYFEHTPSISVGNKLVLDKLVKEHIAPYFKKHKGDFDSSTGLKISLFSDINGKIQDVRIAYPREIGILPISVIENFEQAVLSSCVKLEFDNQKREFKGSTWVGQYAPYSSENLRNNK